MVHQTAIIDDGAIIGKDTNIWHWSHISSGAIIGNSVVIGQNVYVANNAKIGNRCKIQNNVSIYDNVFLEDDVFCGPSVVFTNVNNPRAFINRKDEYLNTFIKKGATLGANSTIVCGVTIDEYAFVGAGAVVTSSLKKFSKNIGVPTRQTGWVTKEGNPIPLPIEGKGEWTCPISRETYVLNDNLLSLKKDD
jgi:UDP-2-acetamido-3-amino-2,3-dideoxy-glucuronate N-acetyltransferase